MKKIFTLLMMLFAFVGAVSAQTFVEPVTGGFYKLKGDNQPSNSQSKPWLTNTNKDGGQKCIVVSANEGEAAIFLKTEKGLKDVATGKYIGMNGSNISMVDTETAITLDEKQDNGKYRVKVSDNYMYNNNTDGIVHESSGWITNIERFWGFVEAKEVGTLENWSNDYKFKVSGHRGFIFAEENNTLKGTNNTSTTYDANNPYHHFAIIKFNDKFYLYNIGAKMFVVRNGENGQGQGVALSENPKHAIEITSASNLSTLYDWKMTLNGAEMCLSNGGANTYGILCANGTEDEGTRWAFEKVSKYDVSSIIENHFYVNYSLKDNAGNTYTANNVEGTIGVDPVFTGIPVASEEDAKDGYLLENGSWNGNTFTATITFPFIVSSASQSNPMLIGQAFDSDTKMWTAVGGNVNKVNAVDGIPSLGASQWMIYPSLNGTEFTFKIKSVSTDKYVTATAGGVTLTTDGTNFQCGRTEANRKSAFVWTCTNGDETLYVTRGSDDNNTPLGMTTDVATAGEKAFVAFQEFKSFKVTIGTARYTTVYAPFTAIMPYELNMGKTVDIYAITDGKVVNDKVQLSQMSWYIPREQAAILNGEQGTYVFAKTDDNLDADTDAVWEQNLLKGSSVNTIVEGDAYVLGVIGEEVGLYKAELNMNEEGVKVGKETGTCFLNNAGKAYLPASAITTTQGVLRFNFGGTTAIESVLNNSTDANAPIYDLSGRRVMNTVKGGIYIQNGKKFIVK